VDATNTLGVILGSLVIAFGLAVIIWARYVRRITQNQLRLFFGEQFMRDATPAMVRVGGAAVVIVGAIMLVLGLTQQF
jgi:hypothetical protein